MLFNVCFAFWVCLVHAISIPVTFSASELQHVQGDPKATHRVAFAITRNGQYMGELAFALFGDTTPKTVENFVALTNMSKGYGYELVTFHRIIKDFMIQGGDFENGDGTGGHSIYGKRFPDESFEVHHNKRGRLSMANSGKDTNGAQFFITTKQDCSWLDGKHVVFGQLVGGFELLEMMENTPTDAKNKPNDKWVIMKGMGVPVDYSIQRPYDELKQEADLEAAALRGETTLINDQVREADIAGETDPMGGYIFMGGFCLIVLILWRLNQSAKRCKNHNF
ncbi:hypothetical protein FT663_01215 [Candidozyma haemuli var. vulneris]|uniref:Peptidyl-prolyl cis-trans isomerase n=1 Tax=Candidozyma haemuli TaxID=45357 RepID=A0A2V1B046_9ASCO|nr:hypothetical protein CXQ85_005080 [[Candida] haemuloni]KAF3992266.1 hypothetical protein FT662_01283 [[Candida] haemuloni var. vulneris]KAF3994637.1 hypothetical protein FT663_01215 [[Candida] haemuloni var. vulneris]PVH22511.1 hypothetical protein CXQ85_005080 [[Candida] haemuloni]